MRVIKLLKSFSENFLKDAARWHLYAVVCVWESNAKEVAA